MSFRRNLVSPNEEGTHAPPPAATPSMRLLAWNEEEQARERLNFPFPDDSKAPETGDSVRGYFRKMKERHQHRVATYAFLDWLAVFLPCVRWLRTYQVRKWLLSDIVAGLSVGFMVVPQGMSYANLAGLPSVYGLYGAFLPCIVYSLVGSSRQLAVGPVAVTSLLIGTKLKDILPAAADIQSPNAPAPGQEEIQEQYNHLAIQLAFLVACLYTGVGVFRLGFVTNFLSHAVIGGFTSGAAITIGLSQVKYILGFSVPRQERLQDQAKTYVENMHNLKWQEFIMGSTFLLILVVMKYVGKNFKRLRFIRAVGPLTVCIIGICAVYIGHVDTKGIKVVGPIKKGLPDPTVQWWFPMPEISTLFPTAIIVMLVDLLESTSIARALARKNKYELVANQEIVGLGLANFAGAAFSCYTTTGSFSRSAVNNESGAKSGLACFITAWVVGFVLIFLTPIFERLPMNTLGAIILSSIVGLLEYEQAIYLWKVNKLDLFVWMASFLGVLFISVEIGLGIAIGLAVLIVIYESAFPHTALVGRIPGTSIWRNIKQYPQAQLTPGLMVVRIDAPLYFANIQWVKEKLEQYLDHHRTWSADRGIPLEYAILDFSPVTHVDATAVHTLEILIEALAEEGTQLVLANPSTAVIRSLDKARVCDILGRDWIFVSVNEAVQFCSRQLAERGLVVQPESVWPKGAGYGGSHGSGAHSPSSGSPPRSPPGAAPSVALVPATSMRRSASGAGYTAPPPLQSPTPQPQLQQQPSSGRPGSGPAPSPALAAGNSLRRLPSAAGGAGIAPPEGVPQQPPRPSLPGSSVDPAAAAPVADVDAEPAVVFLPTGSVSVRGSQSGISTGAASPTLPRPPSNALGGASALPAATN